jgi:hypothetical protein
MRAFCGLCLVLLWAMPTAGRDIYVDNATGDDLYTGHRPRSAADPNGPVRTITRAVRLAQPGDTLVLTKNDQPYRECVSLVGTHNSGLVGRPFTLRGNGAILDGSAPVPPEAWQNFSGPVFRFRPPRMGFAQLLLDNRPATRVPVGHAAERPPQLKARQWCLLDGQIYFCVEPTKLPHDYKLSYASLQTGITLYQVNDVRIVDLVVQAFQLDGISLANSARHVALLGVTCRGNGRSGVTVGGASVVDIRQSILGDNGAAQLLTRPYSETHVFDSHLLSNTAPGWVDQGGRVFLDGKLREGGLDELHPATLQEKKP